MATEEVERTDAFGLMDTESGNMVGSFASEQEALLAVAATARDFGPASDAVLSLSLFRWDVPAEQGFIADGADLVRRALDAAHVVETAFADARPGVSRNARRTAGRSPTEHGANGPCVGMALPVPADS
jgi:hypothetical protein